MSAMIPSWRDFSQNNSNAGSGWRNGSAGWVWGGFVIARLSPGPHVIRVEPLDDADVDGFFTPASRVDLDFRVRFADRLVVVPRAGDSGSVEIKVSPK